MLLAEQSDEIAPGAGDDLDKACEPTEAEIATAKTAQLLIGTFFGLIVGAVVGVAIESSP